MAARKTLIATGCSSGIGLDIIRQVIAQPTPWTIHLAARTPDKVSSAVSSFSHGSSSTTANAHHVDLLELHSVQSFASSTLQALGDSKLDYLLLNAGMLGNEREPPVKGARYTDAFIVNHLAHHYLVHLLRQKLVASGTRIVFVSSGAIRQVEDASEIEEAIKAGSKTSTTEQWKHYAQTKFAALIGALWWRRELAGSCEVVAVSPGLIPGSGLAKGDLSLPTDHPDAKSVEEGAQNVLRAFEKDDIPEDPEQILLTSWAEWWPKDVYSKALDKTLWDKLCPSAEELEQLSS